MRNLILGVAAIAAMSSAAIAQDASFRGIRVEGNAGWDQYRAGGDRNGKFAFGGEAGFDGQIGSRIVIGPEFNYWHPNHGRNTVAYNNGVNNVTRQSRDQYGSAIRVGYLATPDLLIYGKGGYVNASQSRIAVTPAGVLVAAGSGHTNGYQYGGGVEYTLHDRFSSVPGGLYISGQYVRDRFDNGTHDQHAMGGIGFRFR